MKKRILAIMMTVALLMSAAGAYTSQQLNTADAMNHLGLFKGTDKGYELDEKLTRVQGTILLIRMIGKEDEAIQGSYTMKFTDVLNWAKNYVGYAYANKITNGVSATLFRPDKEMTDYMFLTLVLRALGYSDSGENAQFVWDDPYALAAEVGLIDKAEADSDFRRADAIEVFWSAMSVKFNGSEETLSERLIRQGVFTSEEYSEAKEIRANGKPVEKDSSVSTDNSGSGSSSGGSSSSSSSSSGGSGNSGSTTEKAPEDYTYEEYNAMTGDEQQEFVAKFPNIMDFMNWYNAAKAKYDEDNKPIEIGGNGSIDLGDIINGQS